MSNGETVPLKPNIRVVFECDSLEHVAPSTISRCQIIYFDEDINPLSNWDKNLPGLIGARTHLLLSSPIINKTIEKKLFLERMSRMFSLYNKFSENDENLCKFLSFIVTSTFIEPHRQLKWMRRIGIRTDDIYRHFPMVIGQWMEFEDVKDAERNFKKLLIKQLVQFGDFLVTVYGSYGSEKSKFIQDVVDSFEKER